MDDRQRSYLVLLLLTVGAICVAYIIYRPFLKSLFLAVAPVCLALLGLVTSIGVGDIYLDIVAALVAVLAPISIWWLVLFTGPSLKALFQRH
jgi:membrane protein required for beta-lactamase induction